MSLSSSTLHPALNISSRRSRTGTAANSFLNNPPAVLGEIDPNDDDGLSAVEAQSKALQLEKETLIKRAKLKRLRVKVEGLQVEEANKKQ